MTFNPTAAISILELLKQVPLDKELIIELGSQRYTAPHIFPAKSTPDFYMQQGFKQYIALDVDDKPDTIKTDLNEPVEGLDKACLVTNIGTGEHIFDQAMVFSNMHDLCKVGGLLYFHLPFTPWLNHGFYNYNPILFAALAYANDYDMVLMHVTDREGNALDLPYEEIVREVGQAKLEAAAKASKRNLFVSCAMRKQKELPFKKPFQGRYIKDIRDDGILQRYK